VKKFFVFIFLLSFALGFSQTNPIATDVKTAHFKDVNGLIHLVGSDAEFGVLTYTIVSLPTHGTLKDPLNSDAIISVGASLTGNLVTFVPHSDENHKYIFSGITSFTYKVTDDTSRESDTKTVSVKVFDSYLNPPTLIGSEIDGKSAGDNFGRSIALSEDGTIMAVGSPYNDGNGEKAGLVRVYKYNGTSWAQLGIDTQLQGAAAGDYFGSSVSLSGDGTIIAVGLPYHTGESSNSGEVKIFKFESDSWSQLGATVIPPYTPSGSSKAVSEQFGNDVRLSSDGKTLAVSDIWFDRSGGTNSGRVVVYRYDGISWSSIGDEFALYGSNNDNLSWGLSLSSNGNILAVGGHENDDAASNAGQVKIFEYDSANTEWDLKSTLLGDSSNDKFGAAIDLNSSGLIVAVGSPYDKPDSFTAQGSVSVYGWNGTSYVILGSEIKGEHKFDYFGSHLSLDNEGSSLAIMAPGHDNQENSPYLKKGHVKVYNYEVSSWVQSADIDGAEDANQSTGSNAESKGQRVFLSGDGSVLAIGADENDGSTGTDSGHVRVYKLFENQIIPQSTSQTVAFELFEQQTSSEEIILTGSDGDSGPSDLIYIITELNTAKLFEGSTEITSADIPHTLTANKVKYNSNSDVVVNDSFKFIVHDGKASSVPDTVTLTVTPDNDAPIAADQSVSTNEDVALDAITLASTDVDSPQGDMIYIIETLPTKGTLKEGGTAITVSGTVLTAKDIIYTPSSNYSGADSFKFKVKDKGVGSDGVTDVETSAIAATISITVNNTDNDAPVAEIQSIILSSDATETGAITLVAKDFDDDDSTLTYTIASLPSNGKLKVDGTEISATGDLSGVLTYSPNVDFNGDDTFTFTAKDDEGAVSDPATVTISVTNVNDSPVSQDQSITTREDTVTDPAITLVATDVDDDDSTLVYTILTLPSKGTLKDGATEISAAGTVLSGATLTYTPNTNYNGNDSFTFSAKDDESAVSEIATVSITVSSWNDPPVADPQNLNTFEDVPLSLTLTGTDVDEDELTYILYSLPSNGTLKQGETTIVAGDLPKTLSSKDFSYVPNSKYKGTDSFKFKVRDLTPDFFASTNNLIFVKNGANKVTYETELGKTYFLIEPTATKMDWPVAKNLTDSFYGARMYIPINAEVEKSVYDALNSMSRLDGPFWMGLYQDRKASDYSEPGGGWIWVDGVKLEDRYTNWYSNEPNNAGNEDYGQFNFGSFKIKWNDMSVGNGQSYALFQFTAEDSTAEINITISEFNNPPVADSQNLKTDEDTALKIKLTASDVENDPLTYVVKTLPNYGQLKDGNKVILESELPRVLPADSLSYIPNLDYIGDDSFDFLVKANSLASFAKANGLKFISQDGVPVTYQKPAGKTYFLIQNETGQSGFNPVDWPVAKTLTESIEGAGMYVILNAEMSALVMNGLNNMGVGKGTSNLYWLGLYQDKTSSDYAEPGGEDQNWGGWTWTDGVTLKDRGYFNWRPGEPNQSGPEDYGQINWAQGGEPWNDMRLGAGQSWPLFEFSINNINDSNTAKISIKVEAVNDPPVASDQTLKGVEDTPLDITLVAVDPEGTLDMAYVIKSLPVDGLLTIGSTAIVAADLPKVLPSNTVTYNPIEDSNGDDSFTFYAIDKDCPNTNKSTLTVTGDFTASASGSNPMVIPPQLIKGTESVNQKTVDIKFTVGEGDIFQSCEIKLDIRSFDDGLQFNIEGVNLLNFQQKHWDSGLGGAATEFNGSGRFVTSGSMWQPWNGDGNPKLEIATGKIKLMVDTKDGGREDALPFMDTTVADWALVESFTYDCEAGFNLKIGNQNGGGGPGGIDADLTVEAYIVPCEQSNVATVSIEIDPVNDLPESDPGNYSTKEDVPIDIIHVGRDKDLIDVFTTHTQMGTTLPQPSEQLGESLALSANGKRLILGAYSTGAFARVYDWNGTDWEQLGETLNGETNGDWFGEYVSISNDGNRIAVAGSLNDNANGTDAGHIKVFDWNGTSWDIVGSPILGNNAGDTLGYRGVHLSGDGRTLATISFSGGYVVTYAWDGSAWNKIGALIDIVKSPGNPGSPGQVYLSTDGKRLAVGSVADGSKGNVRVFDWDGSSWIQFASIDGKSGNFGCAIDLSRDGKKLIVGEKNTSLTSVYDISGASPVQIGADINYSGNQSSVFWRYVSISDDGNRVGIPVMSSKLGVFDWDGTLWNQLGKDVTGGFGESFDMSSDAKIMAAGIHSGPNKVFNILNLEYIITTLPSNGTLKEGAKTLVAADLPYTLTTSDQKLTYTPNNNYYGTDSYLFKLNDGKADSTNSLNGNREDSKVTITIEEFTLTLPSNYKTSTIESCEGSDVGILNIEVAATTFRKTGTTVDIPITYNVAIVGKGNVGTIVSPNKILQVKDLAKGTYELKFTIDGEPKYVHPKVEFTIDEIATPTVYDVGKIEVCDDAVDGDDLNGKAKFDTSTIINGLLKDPNTGVAQDANLLDIEFTYFDQATNASVSAATLPNPFYSGSQTVTVKLTSKANTSCIGLGAVVFVVNTLPVFERIDDTKFVCLNLDAVTIGVKSSDSRTYSYTWTRNGTAFNLNIPGFDSTILIGLGGDYEVTATTTDGTSCSQVLKFNIGESDIATVLKKDIIIADLNPGPNNTITVLTETLGIGDYEFAIDDVSGPYQDEPTFENVRPGLHTIYIRDKNECGVVNIKSIVIGYKKFFTPNGDGIHDTWNIIGLTKTSLPNSKIYIFDRFGKLLKQLDPLSPGWDGTFIGKPMPSTDYWFRVQLEDGREFKSHFSLVRDWN
jgi:gliding motility-associated-like protein